MRSNLFVSFYKSLRASNLCFCASKFMSKRFLRAAKKFCSINGSTITSLANFTRASN